jgi:16S rRNA processing protein RimM
VTVGVADDLLTVARIVRSHGVHGELKIMCSATQLEVLVPGAHVDIHGSSYTVTDRRGSDDKPILRLAEVVDRTAADALRGSDIRMHRDDLPPPSDDEWFVADLVGCAVRDGDRELGTVAEVSILPANDVLVVRPPSGPDILVPLINDAVRDVDLDARTIDVDSDFLGLEDGT